MTGETRRIRTSAGSIVVTLTSGLARDRGLIPGVEVEQRSLPRTVEEFHELEKEMRDRGVPLRGMMLIPVEPTT